ncbi:MAG: hypothetical protein SGPRY_014689 [Prymnesium sp.]
MDLRRAPASVELTSCTKWRDPFVHEMSIEPLLDHTGEARCFQVTSLVLKMPCRSEAAKAPQQPARDPDEMHFYLPSCTSAMPSGGDEGTAQMFDCADKSVQGWENNMCSLTSSLDTASSQAVPVLQPVYHLEGELTSAEAEDISHWCTCQHLQSHPARPSLTPCTPHSRVWRRWHGGDEDLVRGL